MCAGAPSVSVWCVVSFVAGVTAELVTCQLRTQRTQALRAGLAEATSNLVTVLPPVRRDVKVPSHLPYH